MKNVFSPACCYKLAFPVAFSLPHIKPFHVSQWSFPTAREFYFGFSQRRRFFRGCRTQDEIRRLQVSIGQHSTVSNAELPKLIRSADNLLRQVFPLENTDPVLNHLRFGRRPSEKHARRVQSPCCWRSKGVSRFIREFSSSEIAV